MTKFVISVRLKDDVSGGNKTTLHKQEINTEKLETDSIKSDVKVAFKRLETEIKAVFPNYGDKQTKLEDFEAK